MARDNADGATLTKKGDETRRTTRDEIEESLHRIAKERV
jgi:hypothetical protein